MEIPSNFGWNDNSILWWNYQVLGNEYFHSLVQSNKGMLPPFLSFPPYSFQPNGHLQLKVLWWVQPCKHVLGSNWSKWALMGMREEIITLEDSAELTHLGLMLCMSLSGYVDLACDPWWAVQNPQVHALWAKARRPIRGGQEMRLDQRERCFILCWI